MRRALALVLACLTLLQVDANALDQVQDAVGNSFSAPLRATQKNLVDEEWRNPPCNASVIHPKVAVTAAHCVNKVGPNSGFPYGEIWVQEPGKNKNDENALRVKVSRIIYPDEINIEKNQLPVKDIAFLVLENEIIAKQLIEIASLDEVKSLVESKSYVYGYGYFFADLIKFENWRTSQEKFPHSNPRKARAVLIENPYINDKFWNGFPNSLIYRVRPCTASFGSGSPMTAIINGKEKLIAISGSSSGWSCDDNPQRNVGRAIIVANYLNLVQDEIVKFDSEQKPTEPIPSLSPSPQPEPTVAVQSEPSVGAEPTEEAVNGRKESKIVCFKGKNKKIVYGIKPKCPKGFKKR